MKWIFTCFWFDNLFFLDICSFYNICEKCTLLGIHMSFLDPPHFVEVRHLCKLDRKSVFINTTALISSWINLSKIAPNAHSDKKQAGEYETPGFEIHHKYQWYLLYSLLIWWSSYISCVIRGHKKTRLD